MNALELTEALRTQYPASHGWILLPQVRDATGAGGGRTADAVAFNAWPSRGLELHGFELKTYRGDWLRELRQPAKAESIFQFCDRWWIVTPAPDKGHGPEVVRANELPATWGLITVHDGKVDAVPKDAAKLEAKALDRVFVAAVLRALQKCETPEAKIAAARAEGVTEGRKLGKEQAAFMMSPREVDMVRWKRESLEQIAKSVEFILKDVRRELADIRKLPQRPPAYEEEDDGKAAHPPIPSPDTDPGWPR